MQVVCKKCFYLSVQTAVQERCLPLRCVLCRTKILRLQQACDVTAQTLRRHKSFDVIKRKSSVRMERRAFASDDEISSRARKRQGREDRALLRNDSVTSSLSSSSSSSSLTSSFASRKLRSLLIYPDKHEPKRAFFVTSSKQVKYTRMTSLSGDAGADLDTNNKQLSINLDYAPPSYHEATPLLSSIPEEIA